MQYAWPLCGALLLFGCDGGGEDSSRDGSGGRPVPGQMGTGDAGSGGDQPIARFEIADDPATTRLAEIPYPSDVYRTDDGTIDLRGFPQPQPVALLAQLIDSLEKSVDGFATTGALYLSFDRPIDLDRLPADATASLADDATLFLVDVDPESKERGRRWPIYWYFDEDGSDYLPTFSLAVRLVEGIALRPKTTYAMVLTDGAAAPSPAFARTLAADEPDAAGLAAAWRVHASLRAWLEDDPTAPAIASIAVAGVFTTEDPVSELFQLRDFIQTLPTPPLSRIESRGERLNRFWLYEGEYSAPRFQAGEIPYRAADSGDIRFDDAGTPIVQASETIRFALSVPLGPAPEEGWPLVMYGHGTGGDYHSFINAKVASVLARHGVAVISIDQIHHGPRDLGACANAQDATTCRGLLFFNFLVPNAGRDNVRQSALDFVSLLRFARALEVPPYQSDGKMFDVRIDDQNVQFMGHSQGGINGPLFLAVEPTVKGGMLSAAGANFALAIEQKKLPGANEIEIRAPVAALLGLADDDPLDRWHPVLMLLQTFIEPADGGNYARFWFHEPPESYPPKSIFMTIGLDDVYTPPDTNYALATAGRVPVIDPVVVEIEGLTLLGIEPDFPPYRGNVANGEASAGLAQYPDGDHYIIQTFNSAQARYGKFMESLARDNPPQIF